MKWAIIILVVIGTAAYFFPKGTRSVANKTVNTTIDVADSLAHTAVHVTKEALKDVGETNKRNE